MFDEQALNKEQRPVSEGVPKELQGATSEARSTVEDEIHKNVPTTSRHVNVSNKGNPTASGVTSASHS